jgi:predicted nucleotidyltransferase
MNRSAPILAPIFRSNTQGRILATLFAEPEREFTLNTLAAAAGASQATTWREVDRAESAGIVSIRKAGQALLVHADQTNRFFGPMRELVLGSFGAPAVISREFGSVSGVATMILFGSWAARYQGTPGGPPADIDVLLIGRPNREEAYAAAERAEAELGISVQVTIRSVAQWANPDPFLREVRSRPMIVLAAQNEVDEVKDPRVPPGIDQ